MKGWRQTTFAWCLLAWGLLAYGSDDALGQIVESSDPIGGITFKPPRRVTIRHKSRKIYRGDLIAISPDLVHFRVQGGKEFHLAFMDVSSISTNDGDLKFTSAYDTYRKLVEQAAGLKGVTVDAKAQAAASNKPVEVPRPPAPSMAVMLDPPGKYRRPETKTEAVPQAVQRPEAVSPVPVAQQSAAPAGPTLPIYETGAFKIGFLIACLAVVALWWRNKVG